MDKRFFFYDLETSGLSARDSRIMQFAGQRTDLDMNLLDESHNYLIKQTEDILPDPEAIMITGITPQKTIEEGMTEDEFIKVFNDKISTPGTIFVGYNNISFDDEFIRFLLFRNLYDSYEWQWRDERSKWDMLDVIRTTRALRPEGIEWPTINNKSSNKLEDLAKANNIEHVRAHDAMSDVEVLIAITKLVKDKQPKLFEFLLNMREKNKVMELVNNEVRFIHVAGSYSDEHEKTSIVCVVDGSQTKQGVVVYDLTIDPELFKDMSPEELALSMRLKRDDPGIRLPIKNIQYNRCPAVAPEIVLKDDDRLRLKLDKKLIDENYKKFLSMPELSSNIVSAQKILDDQRKSFYSDSEKYSVEASLYDGFIDNQDKNKMNQLHSSSSNISSNIKFLDKRLNQLLPLFIARNYPKLMNENIHSIYEEYRQKYFYAGDNNSRAAKYYMKLAELESRDNITSEEKYLIEELKLWGEAIMPSDSDF